MKYDMTSKSKNKTSTSMPTPSGSSPKNTKEWDDELHRAIVARPIGEAAKEATAKARKRALKAKAAGAERVRKEYPELAHLLPNN